MKKNSKHETQKHQSNKPRTTKAPPSAEGAAGKSKTRPLTQLEQQLEQQRIQMQKDNEISAVAGVDIGDKRCFVRLTDLDGESLEECQIPTRPKALDRWFRRWPRLRIVIETGSHSNWIRRRLAALAHDVLVADARQLRLISQSDSKNDRNDAYWLAELGRTNPALLNPVAPRKLETEQQRTLLRAREAVLECRTKLKGSLRGMAKSHGIRLGRCAQTQWVERVREACPEVLHAALLGVAMQIESLGATIREYDKQIVALGKRYAAVERLRTIGRSGAADGVDVRVGARQRPGTRKAFAAGRRAGGAASQATRIGRAVTAAGRDQIGRSSAAADVDSVRALGVGAVRDRLDAEALGFGFGGARRRTCEEAGGRGGGAQVGGADACVVGETRKLRSDARADGNGFPIRQGR